MASGENGSFEWVPGSSRLSNGELDRKLQNEVDRNEESEMLICGYLNEVQERRAFRDFGLGSIYDYASERFGFSERKTRYLLALGRKLKELPRVREALRTGKIGWCKASRVASVATRDTEAMWLDSALSQSVRELEHRIKDGTDRLASSILFSLNEDQRVMWEAALEIARRISGCNISPTEAFEYCVAEMVGTYAHLLRETDDEGEQQDEEGAGETETEAGAGEGSSPEDDEEPAPGAEGSEEPKVCPSDGEAMAGPPDGTPYKKVWREVLDRDGWSCRYPGCSARRELHVHHVRYRSHAGKKSLGVTNAPSNLITLCTFHHRLVHAKTIGLSGRAPFEMEWMPPRMMKNVLEQDPERPRWVGELEFVRFRAARTMATESTAEKNLHRQTFAGESSRVTATRRRRLDSERDVPRPSAALRDDGGALVR